MPWIYNTSSALTECALRVHNNIPKNQIILNQRNESNATQKILYFTMYRRHWIHHFSSFQSKKVSFWLIKLTRTKNILKHHSCFLGSSESPERCIRQKQLASYVVRASGREVGAPRILPPTSGKVSRPGKDLTFPVESTCTGYLSR